MGFMKFAGAILGKEAKGFAKGIAGAWKVARNPATVARGKASFHSLKFALIPPTIFTLLSPGTPEEKMKSLATNVGLTFLTLGMTSPWRQFGWMFAASMAPSFGHLTRGIVRGYRGALEARTSLAIPFSHSTMAMDQAFSTMQYSRERMSDSYSNVGSEAGFMAARYMAR